MIKNKLIKKEINILQSRLNMKKVEYKDFRSFVNILEKRFYYSISNDFLIYESLQLRFVCCLSGYKKLNREYFINASIKSSKKHFKQIFKEEKKLESHVKYKDALIAPHDWEMSASFFKMNVEDLKIVSQLPSNKFYNTSEWRSLRYHVIKLRGRSCECCGNGMNDGKPIHVDHILPRSVYQEHALNIDNLQILCEDCNIAKSNQDKTDWRM